MAYEPQFTISARLLSLVEQITVLRERIQSAAPAPHLTPLPLCDYDESC